MEKELKLSTRQKKVFLLVGVWVMICFYFLFADYFSKELRNIKVFYQTKLTAATEAGFRDENFYSCVLSSAGKPNGTVLTDEQLSNITEVVCEKSNVSSISGVEKLTSLRNLNLNENNITSVNLSNNKNLQMLNLTFNKLSNIDVSNNIELQGLYLNSNNLTSIDVSKNTKLLDLNLNNNKISNIDISKNTMLKYILFSKNHLSNLDLSSNTKLEHIYASSNQINNLKLPVTSTVTRLDLNDNNLSSIDVSNFVNLDYLIVSDNKISFLELSKNTNLTKLYASSNNINEINLNNNIKLFDLDLAYNNIKSIDLTKLNSLDYLNLSVNYLKNIDVSNLTKLTKIYISSNNLTGIDLSKNNNLKEISVVFNKFDNLEVFNPSIVEYMVIENEWINNYNFSKFSKLSKLDVVYYQIIPIYGESLPTKDLLEFIPTNISFSKYDVYNVFDSVTSQNQISSDKIQGKLGGYSRFQISSNEISINNISFNETINYRGYYELRFMKITSDKYVIDETNNKIDVGGDDNETIQSNLKASWGDTVYGIEGNTLNIYYNNIKLKEFTLLRTTNPKTGDILIGIIILLTIFGAVTSLLIYRKKLENKI